jgi:alkanesulfonate monooxygenase
LAAVTSRIEIIAAIKPYFVNPVVLAKMALGIEDISGGRMALNIVNGWNRDEAERTGWRSSTTTNATRTGPSG